MSSTEFHSDLMSFITKVHMRMSLKIKDRSWTTGLNRIKDADLTCTSVSFMIYALIKNLT